MNGDGDSSTEALTAQLRELNQRSRWYTSQLWQIPFSYFALAGVVFGLTEPPRQDLGLLLSIFGMVGVAVGLHACGLVGGVNAAVRHLKLVERKLQLTPTAQRRHWLLLYPFVGWSGSRPSYLEPSGSAS